jgi:hypothetical protein
MTIQPEALRLADWLDADACDLLQQSLNQNTELDQKLAEIEAENEALRADAERYRYLRNRNPQEILPVIGPAAGVWIDCDDEDGELTLLTGEDADAAIDAARNMT